MPSLKGRISRLKALGLVKASDLGAVSDEIAASPETNVGDPLGQARETGATLYRRAKGALPERERFLPGWERIASHLYVRTIVVNDNPGDSGSAGFHPAYFERHRLSSRPAGAPPAAPDLTLDRLSFFDLETTGLSGGTGTIAFLAAIGYFEGADFLVTQAFLDDFPGEPRFLDTIVGLLSRRPHVVTYNGAAFDLPLLRTRCIMNAVTVPDLTHTDLLKTARRLWRRTIGNCSLQSIESAVLGEERVGDIPGFMIPGFWLEYSASGEPMPATLLAMGKIAEHNAKDVSSLARILLRVERIMAEPERRWAADKVCAPRLAAELMALGREEEGLSILEASGAEGNQDALILLARLRRRRREFEAYERAVLAMDGDSLSGLVERAKLYEHRKRDYLGALLCAERATAMLREMREEGDGTAPSRLDEALDALHRRAERLHLRLARETRLKDEGRR